MPRIYDSTSSPLDFCKECFPTADDAEERFGAVGDGPDGRGNCYDYNSDHPPYQFEDYVCYDCGRSLTKRDN